MKVSELFRKREVDGDVGIEIEVEGEDLPKYITKYWSVEMDGSLRGNDNAEYVLRKPIAIDQIPTAMRELNAAMEEEGASVDMSRRTSTHIHINCQQLEVKHLANYVTLLLIMEEVLVDWCGEERAGNLFCLQSKDANMMVETAIRFFTNLHRFELGDAIRYSAINLAALPKYGSLEIRSLYGTIDTDIIVKWAGVLNKIKESAKLYDNPVDIIRDMSLLESGQFVKKIIGDYSKVFYVGAGRKKKLLGGVRRAQDLAFLVDWPAMEERLEGFRQVKANPANAPEDVPIEERLERHHRLLKEWKKMQELPQFEPLERVFE